MSAGPTILAILYAAPRRSGAEGGSAPIEAHDLGAPFETTLEEALAAIEREPRGYVEPDGSFSLHEAGEGSSARIDGEIYDCVVPGIGDRVHHVDVRGPGVACLWRTIFGVLSPRGAEGIVVFLPDVGEAFLGEAFLERLETERPAE